ncbi:GNAT family N-acetyltransferase [Eubacterium callanderi]|uniref:GNAT family N-acetyltransferase n=1 Tax=Eubacterium callanderi TaxID=53442 RepID=UPI001C108CE6|nr:GNAT family N-acetyltransferase [Eubacterium callanderi]MBU5302651.1 GNAT family N-acetyltransferase [Eubacterium callanderi]WPK69703.1 hypothetical protein EUCA2A_38930 [Eubacterium callanderi]WPK74001.1 hypothetical protein EUCA11A_38930 [Eubacterium callanderi]
MNTEIKNIHLLQYILSYSDTFPKGAVSFGQKAVKNGGAMLLALEDQNPAGILILDVPAPQNYDVAYLYVKPECRNRGIAQALLKKACAIARDEHKMLGLRVLEEHEAAKAFTRLAGSLQFNKVMTSEIFRCIPTMPKTKENWSTFLSTRGNKLCSYLTRRGYHTGPLSEAPEGVRENMIYKFSKNIFPMFSNPFNSKVTDMNYSFVASKDGEAAAFCTAEAYDGRYILRALVADKTFQKKGAFILPLIAFISKVIENECPLVCYTVYENNRDMLALADGFLTAVTHEVRHQTFYKR